MSKKGATQRVSDINGSVQLLPLRPVLPPPSTFAFLDQQHGWLALDQSILVTSDGGATWATASHIDSPANDIDFVSPQQGWAATTSGLLATNDGGRTWTQLVTPAMPVLQVDFADAIDGWLEAGAAAGSTFATHDGGRSWTEMTVPCGALHDDIRFSLVTPTTGWVACASRPDAAGVSTKQVYRTADGGADWTPVASPHLGNTGKLTGLSFLDGEHGWLGTPGSHGLLNTADGGQNWFPVWGRPVESRGAAGQIQLLTPTDGFALVAVNGQSYLVRTTDGGQTFDQIYPPLQPVRALPQQMLSQKTWLAIGTALNPDALLRTDDAGLTWRTSIPMGVVEVSFADTAHGWAIVGGGASNTLSHDLYRTGNGGAAWTRWGAGSSGLQSISFLTADTGYIVKTNGTLYITDDAGTSLSQVSSDSYTDASFSFADRQHSWRVQNSKLFASTDGAHSWTEVQTGYARVIQAQLFLDGNGWVLAFDCSSGTCAPQLLYTVDGGKTWGKVNPGSIRPAGFRFADPNNGLVADEQDHLYQTPDGGHTWVQVR